MEKQMKKQMKKQLLVLAVSCGLMLAFTGSNGGEEPGNEAMTQGLDAADAKATQKQAVQASDNQEQKDEPSAGIDELLEAARDALREEDWDAVVSNARNALEIDPNNVKAQSYEFSGLLGPLPVKEEGGFRYKVLQGNAIVTGIVLRTGKE
jgi:hypothetical protein